MTLPEFSREFDILYNNIMSNKAMGITEYEKSVFLTQAQEELTISLYKGNSLTNSSFEETEDNRRYINPLITTFEAEIEENKYIGVSEDSKFFRLPDNVLYITYEAAVINNPNNKCHSTTVIPIVPITQDKYNRIRRNPFRNSNERRALRLDYDNGLIEVISKYDIVKYTIKYIKTPPPIVLESLPEGISINGYSTSSECILPPILHRYIIERAVRLAIASWSETGI